MRQVYSRMTISQTADNSQSPDNSQTSETPQRPLRVWPGIVLVVLLWISRFGVKAVIPGIEGFGLGMMGSFGITVLLVVWWAFFSRARHIERWGGLLLIAVALGATWLLKHESMWMLWLLGYALPILWLAFITWAVLTRRLPDKVRRATMVATIVLACSAWLLVRQHGIDGDHVATFAWRWTPSPEERLLAQSNEQPPSVSSSSATTTPVAPTATALPSASATPEPSKDPATAIRPAATEKQPEWPGFRGARRDGVVSGVRIKTNWSASPPVQLWRRPIGPGWSSFAVSGDVFYTQEQRGENEVVACYRMNTGQPVWSHSDAARFFESNAGAGPRGTPTLSNGRVYTFGATGILNALDAANGNVVWSRNVASETNTEVPFWGFSSSPLVTGDVVIVAASGKLVAYEAATGKRRWLGPAAGSSYSSPHLVTIGGVPQIVLMSGAGATSVSPTDGKQLWQHAWR